MVGFFTELEMAWQILKHAGEPTPDPAIAPARSPPLKTNGQQMAAPVAVYESGPVLKFDEAAKLTLAGGHTQWLHKICLRAEPLPKLGLVRQCSVDSIPWK